MPNLHRTITSLNHRNLQNVTQEEAGCNCSTKNKSSCPSRGHCKQKDVVYQATVSTTSLPTNKAHNEVNEPEEGSMRLTRNIQENNSTNPTSKTTFPTRKSARLKIREISQHRTVNEHTKQQK